MELYKIECYSSKLNLIEKVDEIRKLLLESGLRIGYFLFTCKSEKALEPSVQMKKISETEISEACRFITYPYFGKIASGLQITESEKVFANLKKFPKHWFAEFDSLILGGIGGSTEDFYGITNGKGVFFNSFSINLHFNNFINYVHRIPDKENKIVCFTEKLLHSERFKLKYCYIIAELDMEEKKIPVCIPELSESERCDGIFRFDQKENYLTDEKPSTSLKKALSKTKIPDDYTIEINRAHAVFRHRNKENHIIRATLDNSDIGKAGWRQFKISPVAIFTVTYAGVNFRKDICTRFCHKTSQEVLDEFVSECMKLLADITEEVDNFADTVTALKTPPYFEF